MFPWNKAIYAILHSIPHSTPSISKTITFTWFLDIHTVRHLNVCFFFTECGIKQAFNYIYLKSWMIDIYPLNGAIFPNHNFSQHSWKFLVDILLWHGILRLLEHTCCLLMTLLSLRVMISEIFKRWKHVFLFTESLVLNCPL